MKNNRTIHFVFCTILLALLTACASVRQPTPYAIGLLPLSHYSLKTGIEVTDTTYKVFRNDELFQAFFLPATADVRRPDFNGQTVLAIVLKETPAQQALRFDRAEIAGSTMKVYALACTPGAADNCPKNQAVLATAPKSGSVKKVQFFINGQSRNILPL